MGIIKGSEISVYKTTAMTMAVAKQEIRNGIKAKFLILNAKDEESGIASATRIPLFEEDLGDAVFAALSPYRLLDKDGKPVQDAKGGYPIDLMALTTAMETDKGLNDMFKGLLVLGGGMMEDYDLGGEYYANDIDGNKVLDGRGNPVIKSTISVFVQVKHYLPTTDGGLKPVYFAGWGLHERGSRLKAQFYRERVAAAPVAPSEKAGEGGTGDPF